MGFLHVLYAVAATAVLLWLFSGVIERWILFPLVARYRRGAWADDPRYWAVVRHMKHHVETGSADGDEAPLLVPISKVDDALRAQKYFRVATNSSEDRRGGHKKLHHRHR